MSHETQKAYFESAYNTGTDIWSSIAANIPTVLKQFAEAMKTDDIVLDIGSGRGRVAHTLIKYGFRVIGLDYVRSIVEKNNTEAELEGLSRQIKFIEGDALDMPFTDSGFPGAIDIGLMHHLDKNDFAKYATEVARVIAQGGHFLLVVLSKENDTYLSWNPKKSTESDFEYQGTHYHFFTHEEIESLFKEQFRIKLLKTEFIEQRKNEAHVVALMQKR